ncbi:MAG: hypothetical protein RL596_2212 [Bacteroidota bacterium]|jgi:predicted flavoprotein YhiN
MQLLVAHPFDIKGKTTFKEEFVTCGGVNVQNIDPNTMMSKKAANPFFAGEVIHTNFPRIRGLIQY